MEKPEKENKEPRRTPEINRLKNYAFLIILVVILVLLIYYLLHPLFVNLEGEEAPDFSLKDVDGINFTLSENRGKVIVLDIMAIWCPACVDEMKHLRSIHERYEGDDFVMVTISIDGDDTDADLIDFRAEHLANWTFARDTDRIANKYQVGYIPTIVIIDKEGTIRFWDSGVVSTSRLSKEIDRWL